MPIKSRRVNLSIPPAKERSIIDAGRQNRLHNRDGSLSLTTICTEIVYFILELLADKNIRTYLDKKGGTLFDLIRRSVKEYISEEDEKA